MFPRLRNALAIAAAAALAGAAAPAAAQAGTLYVDASSTGGPCSDARPADQVSVDRPWCSLGKAAASAPDGSGVVVRSAIYPELSVQGQNRASYVTFQPFPGERPVIQGLRLDSSSGFRFEGFRITDIVHIEGGSRTQLVRNDISPDGVVAAGRDLLFERNDIHDVTIRFDPNSTGPKCNSFGPGAGIAPHCGFGFRLNDVTNVVIRGNRLSKIPADGIQFAHGVNGAIVEGNLFEHISPFLDPKEHSDGIQILGDSDGVVLRRNFFRDARGLLAESYRGVGTQRNMLVENNVFVKGHHFAVKAFDAPGIRILNNTAWDFGSAGITLVEDTANPAAMRDAVVKNNILNHLFGSAGMFAEEDYNLVADGYRSGAHDLARNPAFVDPGAFNYCLAPNSSAVDAGTSDGTPELDSQGRGRVDLAAAPNRGGGSSPFVDLGAYERQASETAASCGGLPDAGDGTPGDPYSPPAPLPSKLAPAGAVTSPRTATGHRFRLSQARMPRVVGLPLSKAKLRLARTGVPMRLRVVRACVSPRRRRVRRGRVLWQSSKPRQLLDQRSHARVPVTLKVRSRLRRC